MYKVLYIGFLTFQLISVFWKLIIAGNLIL